MSERVKMICEHLQGAEGRKVAELARAYGVSRKTFYKWVKRFQAGSWDGLKDLSRAAHHHPNAVSIQTVARVVELRQRYPFWGAPKLRQKLLDGPGVKAAPAESTISQILKRQGLSGRLGRRARATPTCEPLRHAQNANDVWTIDLKGDFALGNLERCYPLTICDAFSRYFLCLHGFAGCPDLEKVRQTMVATFREYGLPAAIRSDNGAPFASCGLGGLSQLSVWWVRLGIRLERIEPAHPEQNGRHERAHRTLKEQTAQPPRADLPAQQKAFAEFQREYNLERPHEALGQQPPALFYQASPRAYPEQLPEPLGYPPAWPRRRVNQNGLIKWHGQAVRLNAALVDQEVGFEPVGEGLWAVHFAHLVLGQFDERTGQVRGVLRLKDPAPAVEDYTI